MGSIHELNGLTSLVEGIEIKNYVVRNTPIFQNFKIKDLEAKHIIVETEIANKIKAAAIKNGHINIKWGNLRNGTVSSENEIIDRMVKDNFMRPMRVTITTGYDSDAMLWSDNNHTAISYMRRGFQNIGEVPHYIIDVRKEPYIIYVTNDEWLIHNEKDQKYAILRSLRLQKFMENGGYESLRWSLEDLDRQLR